jgi:pSer/pThr/pTyr-binding forkhead associated (FHA) protein
MLKYLTLFLRIIVLGIINIVLFRIIKVMYLDLKNMKLISKEPENDYALEVIAAADTLGISVGSIFPIHKVTSIGRKEDNTICVNDPYLSGSHAKIYLEEGRLIIEDLNSTNGTMKNGEVLKNAEELIIGDTIEIGRLAFKVIG